MPTVKLKRSSVYRSKKKGHQLKKEKKCKPKVEARPDDGRIDFTFNVAAAEGRPTHVRLTVDRADFATVFSKMVEAGGHT